MEKVLSSESMKITATTLVLVNQFIGKSFPGEFRRVQNFLLSLLFVLSCYMYLVLFWSGYPGIPGYSKQDAQQFASWDVDYVKLDGCYSLPTEMDIGKYLQ